MDRQEQGNRRGVRWIRWVARGAGTLVAGLWLFVAIASAVSGLEPWTPESTITTALIVASVLSVGAAWWREGIGGALLLLVGIAHVVFALTQAKHNPGFAVAISGVPFLLVGVLFLASWWVTTGQRRADRSP